MNDRNRATRVRTRWLTVSLLAALAAGCAQMSPPREPAAAAAPAPGPAVFTVTPIGTVANPKGGPVELRLDPRYTDGLKGLDEWSHVQVFYWFDKNDTPAKRAVLQVHPRGDHRNPLTGVFACRAPVRPNLIALSTCRILKVEGAVVTVEKIDAFDGTPILDLKPYIPGPDAPRVGVKVPAWTGRRP
jgi:tRNA-Thr(GGU) m(6)t(6)A37 methyltransferase TsaA